MYEVVSLDAFNPEDASRDLNLTLDHVKSYLENYVLYKNYPIRDLTYEEESLVKAINKVKLMSDVQLQSVIKEHNIDITKLHDDQLLIERTIAGYTDDIQYGITRRYQHFILEPAILYGNTDAPLTKPLTMTDIVVQLSNIAIGVTGKNEIVDAKTKISAMSKISDIYIAHKMLGGNDDDFDDDLIDDMSPEELTEALEFLKKKKAIPEVTQPISPKPKLKKKKTAKPKVKKDPEKEAIIVIERLVIFS